VPEADIETRRRDVRYFPNTDVHPRTHS
jgi:hypothetical protein